ncbi:MAG: flagellar basal-body rod protein FlgG [Phycisphaeraceae bacterium]|nr:flagellar basal-body rod protein FlgG [Phycisphaeraceae bacterium]
MAVIALQSAASAMTALNTSMDVIANNLANVNTPGFKSSRANFQDLLYSKVKQPGLETSTGDRPPFGLFVGLGTRISGTQLNFTEGSPITSDRPLDVMIDGQGFFQVQVPDSQAPGNIAYTRNGQFAVNADGEIVLASDTGRRLIPNITIPSDATGISIQNDGTVLVTQPGSLEATQVGQIEISTFINPQGLQQVGDNLYIATDASGPPIDGTPGTDNRGVLQSNQYEASNVDPTRELIDLIKTQRAFEMNSNTIRAADESLRTVATLRR